MLANAAVVKCHTSVRVPCFQPHLASESFRRAFVIGSNHALPFPSTLMTARFPLPGSSVSLCPLPVIMDTTMRAPLTNARCRKLSANDSCGLSRLRKKASHGFPKETYDKAKSRQPKHGRRHRKVIEALAQRSSVKLDFRSRKPWRFGSMSPWQWIADRGDRTKRDCGEESGTDWRWDRGWRRNAEAVALI